MADYISQIQTPDSTSYNLRASAIPYGVASGGPTAYTVTVSPDVSLVDGAIIAVKFATTSTGSSTLNVNSLGAKSIKQTVNSSMTGVLVSGATYILVYNATDEAWKLAYDYTVYYQKKTANENLPVLTSYADSTLNGQHVVTFTDNTIKVNPSKPSVMEGTSTATGARSHAEGEGSEAIGMNSHCEGYGGYAYGAHSHAEGYRTRANGQGSHSEGLAHNRNIQAQGNGSHAEGNAFGNNTAAGIYVNSTSSGGHAEGYVNGEGNIFVLKDGGHAEGYANGASATISSNGLGAHAEGYVLTGEANSASGNGAHAEGRATAAQNLAEHAEGYFNSSRKASDTYGDPGNTLHSIGIGIGGKIRRNAFEIRQNGDAYMTGIGNYDGTIVNNSSLILPILKCMVQSPDVLHIWQGTQAEYDALPIKYAHTLYLIKEVGAIEYVDLGLTSGNLWAKYNLGATGGTTASNWYGKYFAWGEIEPKTTFLDSNYKYLYDSSNTLYLTKYCSDSTVGYNGYTDSLTTLTNDDDAARHVLGQAWSIPSIEDFLELWDVSYYDTVTDYNGVSGLDGWIFLNNGEELFIPNANYYDNSGIVTDSDFHYWTNQLSSSCLYALDFTSASADGVDRSRFYGLPIRGVMKQN